MTVNQRPSTHDDQERARSAPSTPLFPLAKIIGLKFDLEATMHGVPCLELPLPDDFSLEESAMADLVRWASYRLSQRGRDDVARLLVDALCTYCAEVDGMERDIPACVYETVEGPIRQFVREELHLDADAQREVDRTTQLLVILVDPAVY